MNKDIKIRYSKDFAWGRVTVVIGCDIADVSGWFKPSPAKIQGWVADIIYYPQRYRHENDQKMRLELRKLISNHPKLGKYEKRVRIEKKEGLPNPPDKNGRGDERFI